MTNQKYFIPKAAAFVAGSALVLSAFVPMLAGAQTTTTTTTTTRVSYTFTRDLTIGSTGPDVVALQTWLIGKGFSIPAGPTGYFGMQTRAAVAAFQAANGIVPAAGYFGPITRGRVLAMMGTVPVSTVPGCLPGYVFSPTTGQACTTTTPPGTPGLKGGEADLRNFDLQSGDDLAEGDTNQEIAVAQFDVTGGDINVQRVTVDLQPTLSSGSANEHPWSYIDNLSVYIDGKKVGDIDTGSKSDWDQNNDDSNHSGSLDYYSIDIPVNGIIREGDNQELSIRADAVSSIDTGDQDQTFKLQIPDNGIRSIDAAGIQEYTGEDGNEVNFGFNAEQTGDLTISEASSNPDAGVLAVDANDTSDEYDVLKFTIRNRDSADVDLDNMTFDVATSSPSGSSAADISDIIRRATLDLDGDTYTGDINSNNTIDFDNLNTSVNGNDSIEGTLSVELKSQSGNYSASGESLKFSLASSDVDAESSDNGDTSDVSGTVSGNTFTLSTSGLETNGTSNSSRVTVLNTTSASYGTYTIKFDVTAGDDDLYIPVGADDAMSSSIGAVYNPDAADNFSGTDTSVLTSSADRGGNSNGYFIVRAGDTESFTLTVTLDPSSAGTYEVDMTDLRFNTTGLPATTLTDLDVSDNPDFRTDPVYIPN